MANVTFMVNGAPGRMAQAIASTVVARYGAGHLLRYSLTGPDAEADATCAVGGDGECHDLALVRPDDAEGAWSDIEGEIARLGRPCVAIDFTHPAAAMANAALYSRKTLPFVMGTTGGDPEALGASVLGGSDDMYALIAPNMARPIVLLQAMVKWAAREHPNSLSGFELSSVESHQSGKADVSGTALALIGELDQLGLDDRGITSLREEEGQREFGVPDDALGAHAFHTYRISSPDDTLEVQLRHNVCGSQPYADGAIDAALFVEVQRVARHPKRLWSMIEMLAN